MSLTRRRRRPAATSASAPSSNRAPARPRTAVLQDETRERGSRDSRQQGPARGAPSVQGKKAPTAKLPHWRQPERWFWLTHPESLERELVKPSGRTHIQGPHELVEYATQGGNTRACTVAFFEANTQPWVPGASWRG